MNELGHNHYTPKDSESDPKLLWRRSNGLADNQQTLCSLDTVYIILHCRNYNCQNPIQRLHPHERKGSIWSLNFPNKSEAMTFTHIN